jgi:hypothetical protein
MQFEADLPSPLQISVALTDLIPEACMGVLEPVISITPGVCNKSGLVLPAIAFLENLKLGDCEDGLHSRDDALIRIIMAASGGSLNHVQRNKQSQSTHGRDLVDSWISHSSIFPPQVLIEEKAENQNISAALKDLRDKFFRLPHYTTATVIGIAIAGDLVQFGTYEARGTWQFDLEFNLRIESHRVK